MARGGYAQETRPQETRPRVSCVCFNQDGSRLAVGFDDDAGSSGGLCVFSCEPVSVESCSSASTSKTSTSTSTSSVTAAALLYKTRVSALVLSSQPNVVALHDGGGGMETGTTCKKTSSSSSSSSLLGELSFPASTKVLAVKLRRDAIAVALSDGRAAAYSIDSLRLLRSVETGLNEQGLLALAAGGARTVFACPSLEEGTVRVEFVDAGRSVLVRAAKHAVAAIALSQCAELLATASERGTLVRVFSLGEEAAASASRELRRGADPARMLSLAFSPSVASSSSSSSAAVRAPRWLAAASDKGTVHVWSLSRPAPAPPALTTTTPTTTTKSRLLLAAAAAAAAAGAPSPASLAAKRSSFHFLLPGVLDDKKNKRQEGPPMLAALSFSPGGKAVFAVARSSANGACGLVAVELPDEDRDASSSSSAAAAELFCVPDLFALLPR